MNDRIYEYGKSASGPSICRGYYVVDGNGHLFLIAKHAEPKPGQRVATQADIAVARAKAAPPAPTPAPAPVAPTEPPKFLGRTNLPKDEPAPPSAARMRTPE